MTTSAKTHAEAVLGVFVAVFLTTYGQTPSVVAYLHAHEYLADLLTALTSSFMAIRPYWSKILPANPTQGASPETSSK